MKKFEQVLLVYHITVHSCIDRSDPADCRNLPILPPLGYSTFLKNGALDLSETFASSRNQYNLATTGIKVLNSQVAITSSSFKDD
jgi:hypothetical protein